MLRGKTIIVVVPAYNVERQIVAVVQTMPAFVDHIVVVDDHSRDGTSEVVASIPDHRVILLRNERNRGVGGATIAGLTKALEMGADILVKFDGDGQMDPDRMMDLISPVLDGYDYAKGNRFLHSRELAHMPRLRLLGSFCLTFLTKLVSGYWTIFDPQNGYVAISKESLKLLPLQHLHNRYFFENDMLVNLNMIDASVKDVAMPSRYGDEKSSMKLWKVFFVFPFLFASRFIRRVYWKHILRDFSVIGLFYSLGSILMLFGGLFGAYAWTRSILTGIVATTGSVMIAALPIILGFQLFLQAMLIEIVLCSLEKNRKTSQKVEHQL